MFWNNSDENQLINFILTYLEGNIRKTRFGKIHLEKLGADDTVRAGLEPVAKPCHFLWVDFVL